MFKEILLPIDLNHESSWTSALPVAIEQCKAFGARLHVLTVVPELGMGVVAQYFPAGFVHEMLEKADEQLAAFERTARQWINNAKLITTDFAQLNLAIINGEIDAYFTGGTYSISSARLEGIDTLHAITPSSGPADGKGGINWIELNSAVANPEPAPDILDFLEWITKPEPAFIVANGNGNLQPVSQMAQPEVLSKFTSKQLDALQWDEFEERIENAVEFDIVPNYDTLYDIYSAAIRERS